MARRDGMAEILRVDPRVGALRNGRDCLRERRPWHRGGDEMDSRAFVEVLADYRLDPATGFVVFPAGRRPSQKPRGLSDCLEKALAVSG
jgi:hypothetical protein